MYFSEDYNAADIQLPKWKLISVLEYFFIQKLWIYANQYQIFIQIEMSNPYQYRPSEDIDGDYGVSRTGYRSPGFPASVTEDYDVDFYGESQKRTTQIGGKRRQTHDRKRALNRLQQLKPLVDRIISDCRVESKEVKSGLQALREYQTDVLEELKDIADDDEYGYQYETHPAEEATNLRQEKIVLMNELNGKIRAGNRLAEDYRVLEDDYQDLKNEVARLKKGGKGNYDNWSNEGDGLPVKSYREDRTRTRQTDDVRSRSRSKPVDELKRYRSVETPQAENARLRDELARAYKQIDRLTSVNKDLERKLNLSEQDVTKLEKQLSKRGRGQGRAEGSGDLLAQLEHLKRQNQELRVETIRLLKAKGSNGGSADLQDQIRHLKAFIDEENNTKSQFLEDICKYKGKFSSIEQENRQLRAKVKQLSGQGQSYPSYGSDSVDNYKPKIDFLYNEMNDILGSFGGNKYSSQRDALNQIGTNFQSYY